MTPDSEFFQRDRSQHPPAFTPNYKTTALRSPRIPLWSLQTSLSEATGPVFRPEELGPLDNDLIRNYAHDGDPVGERIIVHGRVLDGNARPVPGVLVAAIVPPCCSRICRAPESPSPVPATAPTLPAR